MSAQWDQARIQQLIDDEIEESLTLEYKSAPALSRSDGKKREITKDVSAVANSAGGIIIYGIAEYEEKDKRHLPLKIDPVDRLKFSGEWLQQILNEIRPRLEGLAIHPVTITSDPSRVVYVVEVDASVVPHQAKDHRYYKHYNFQSAPMEDYEIQDIRRRRISHSQLIRFEVVSSGSMFELLVTNDGDAIAEDVQFNFLTPIIWDKEHLERPKLFAQGTRYLSPGQRFRFEYAHDYVILGNGNAYRQLEVDISYFHPILGQRVLEPVRIDFEDYAKSRVVYDELEELRKTIDRFAKDLTHSRLLRA